MGRRDPTDPIAGGLHHGLDGGPRRLQRTHVVEDQGAQRRRRDLSPSHSLQHGGRSPDENRRPPARPGAGARHDDDLMPGGAGHGMHARRATPRAVHRYGEHEGASARLASGKVPHGGRRVDPGQARPLGRNEGDVASPLNRARERIERLGRRRGRFRRAGRLVLVQERDPWERMAKGRERAVARMGGEGTQGIGSPKVRPDPSGSRLQGPGCAPDRRSRPANRYVDGGSKAHLTSQSARRSSPARSPVTTPSTR